MLEKIVKYIPLSLRANKTCRCAYWALTDYVEIPLRKYASSLREWLKEYLYYARYGHRLKKFKDIHKGQRCFIIGNGPSIRQQDLTKLKNEVTFAVTWFVLHEQYDEINPTYYCISNHSAFSTFDTNMQLHQLLTEKTKNAVKFFPLYGKSFIEKHHFYTGHQVFYFNFPYSLPLSITIWYRGSISPDITKVVYTGSTVINDFCLSLAFYMGFSEVYLLGCDCDYNPSQLHFHPSPDSPQPPGSDYEEWYSEWYNNAMKSYSVVKETFERHGRKIYNAGVGGKLEVFERVNYDELFKANQA